MVLLTYRVHPFPFRTRKLSCIVPTILGWRRPGKIGKCQHNAMRLPMAVVLHVAASVRVAIFLLSSVGRANGASYTEKKSTKTDEKRDLKLYKFHIILLSSVGRARDC